MYNNDDVSLIWESMSHQSKPDTTSDYSVYGTDISLHRNRTDWELIDKITGGVVNRRRSQPGETMDNVYGALMERYISTQIIQL